MQHVKCFSSVGFLNFMITPFLMNGLCALWINSTEKQPLLLSWNIQGLQGKFFIVNSLATTATKANQNKDTRTMLILASDDVNYNQLETSTADN